MDPITAAATLAPIVLGALHKKKKGPNRLAIIQKYRNTRPAGYTTPEDEAAAERTRTRIAGSAQVVARRRRMQNAREVTTRGLSGPAAAALEEQATQVEGAGAEEAARTSADQLYKAFQSNLGYERNKNDTSFGAELGVATQDAARADAQNASFWNSLMETLPGIAQAWAPLGKTPATGSDIITNATQKDPTLLDTSNTTVGPRVTAMTPTAPNLGVYR